MFQNFKKKKNVSAFNTPISKIKLLLEALMRFNRSAIYNIIIDDLENKIQILCHTNIIVSSVPFRYDFPYLNSKIMKLNNKIKPLTNKYNYLQLLELYNLHKNNYTTFGLHLKNTGKLKIGQNLCELLKKLKHQL